jgi:O-antigen ligase
VFVGIGVAGVLLFASDLFFQRMGTISQYQEEGSAMGRIMAWTAATQMANDNPLLGVGGAHFSVKFGVEYRPQDFVGPLPWLNAHSIYFMMLAEFGYPGLLVLLGSLFYCYRAGERILREVRGSDSEIARRYERMFYCLNGSLIAFSVGAAFLSALYYPHWYVIMGLYVAAELMYRRDRARVVADGVPETAASRAAPHMAV